MSDDEYMAAIQEQTEILRELTREIKELRADALKRDRRADATAKAVSRAQRLAR